MALLFLDSFDHYATADLLEKWSSTGTGGGGGSHTVTIEATGRRASSLTLTFNSPWDTAYGYILKTLSPATTTATIGVAIKIPSTAATLVGGAGFPLLMIRQDTSPQLTLRLNAFRTLSVVRGAQNGTVLGTSSATLTAGAWAYIEWQATIHGSTGSTTVKVDGTEVLALTNVNTQNTGTTAWTAVTLGGVESLNGTFSSGSGAFAYDDLYISDSAGAAPFNTFLGDVRVDARFPTAAGATTGWSPTGAASNWDCVNDAAPDDDTTYVAAASSPLTDTYTVQDAPVPGTAPLAVQLNLSVKKSDSGSCSVAPVVRHSGTDQVGADHSPATAYAYHRVLYPTNPGTGAAWTEANFNAAEFGIRRTA